MGSRATARPASSCRCCTAKDGSKVVTGLCQFEGEDGFGTQNFVIRKSQKDPAALTIYSYNGEVFGEVSPCP